ncbi:hypothetical protein ACTOXX_28560 [Streptomyces rubiginosohelvolus]|uniref:hypothetical protein n=1 Tax=Streptomyces TaxID=1883 RepID=UPI00117EB52D|nr:hypothetical protein [Streptomyces sp. t99]
MQKLQQRCCSLLATASRVLLLPQRASLLEGDGSLCRQAIGRLNSYSSTLQDRQQPRFQSSNTQGEDSVGALEPIGDDVGEENRALAEALRTLFNSLGISIRRYAARCYTDPGTISRYLKGTRVPPWSFITTLLAHVAEERDSQTSDETVALVRRLYSRAAGSSGGTRRASDLQHLLEEADEQAREAASLERLVQAALHESQQQVAHLNVELKALRAARAADRQTVKAEIELFTSEADDLRRERDQLQAEIDVLKRQLKEATNARILAEERCDQLERQIERSENEDQSATDPEGRVASSEASDDSNEALARATQEYTVNQKKLEAAQTQLAALQAEVERAKNARLDQESFAAMREHLTSVSPAGSFPNQKSRSLAVRMGYGPEQVLRRIDATKRVRPDDVRTILTRAIDLQAAEEIVRTGDLLKSMPATAQDAWKSALARSVKGAAILGQPPSSGSPLTN